jgi:hypothetical protein
VTTATATAPAPIDRAIGFTRRGEAVVSLIRLRRQIADLDAVDRAYVAELLRELVAGDIDPQN